MVNKHVRDEINEHYNLQDVASFPAGSPFFFLRIKIYYRNFLFLRETLKKD